MPRALLLLSLLGPVLFWAPRAPAQVEGSAPFSTAGTSAEAIDRFLVELREALARDDRGAVADGRRDDPRALPHDAEVEAAVLSALLMDADTVAVVRKILTPDAFYQAAHRRAYEADIELDAAGTRPTPTARGRAAVRLP